MLKVKLLFAAIILSCGLKAQSFVPAGNTNEIKEKIKANAEKLQTIQSDFSQIKHMSFLKSKINSEGKFYFKKDNKLRWKYTSPYHYDITIKDGKIKIINDDKETKFDAGSSKNFKELNDLMIASVTGDIFSSNKFDIKFYESRSHYKLVLFPKEVSMQKNIKAILIYFDRKDIGVDQVRMVEPGKDYTVIYFNNKKLNVDIQESVFDVN